MKKSVINKISILLISFFFLPFVVKAAGSVGVYFSGDSTYKPGDTVSLSINVGTVNGGADGKVYGFNGNIGYDSSCLQLQSINATGGWNPTVNGSKFILANYGLDRGVQNGSIGSVKFTALKDCSTTVTLSGSASDTAGDVSAGSASKTIKIYTPSNNNNLTSLSVTPGGINFNGGTSYSTSVGADVTSVTVSAAAQDSKASVSGTGTRNLNYGANEIKITVTAEDGSKKVYTINVNRKDDRSSNNNLASLSVSGGKLIPGFSKGNTKYSMEVPFETSKINVNAKAEDAKSKVTISNPELVAEEVTQVKITVTAENGVSKTYVIDVKRGKDPNKPLSNNNYLAYLNISEGMMLSPSFDREKLNYAVYLPYEVSHIDISYGVEDTKYATVTAEGNNQLSIGNNLFKYTVTAEDGSKRVYTLTVVRNESLDAPDKQIVTNTYLKKLTLDGGKLVKKFNKKKYVYYYKGGKKVSIKEAIPEVAGNKVTTYKMDKSFVIVVETESGAKGYYLLIEQSNLMLIIILSLLIIIVSLILYIVIKNKKNNKSNENISEKPKKRRKLGRKKE